MDTAEAGSILEDVVYAKDKPQKTGDFNALCKEMAAKFNDYADTILLLGPDYVSDDNLLKAASVWMDYSYTVDKDAVIEGLALAWMTEEEVNSNF